jgi:hypothetical protein
MQSTFDKRDSLKREKAYKREVFSAFWLVRRQNVRRSAEFSCQRERNREVHRISRSFTRVFFLPLIEVRLYLPSFRASCLRAVGYSLSSLGKLTHELLDLQ